MTRFHTLRAVTATGGASAVADAATGAAAAAVNTLRHFFSVLAGALFCLNLTVSARYGAPAGAEFRGHGCSFSAASLSLLFILIRGLIHNDQLVLLPVAGLGITGAVRWLSEAQRGVSAAVGLSG